MAQAQQEEKRPNSQTSIIITVIIVVAILGTILSLIYPEFVTMLSGETYVPGEPIYEAIYVVLTLASDALYLFGGGVITFGAILVIARFIQIKLKDPFQSSSATRVLSGYLTLSLNFFIGAELIRTVATRTFAEFELLILVIFSRGLFSLILYLERRWHGTTETE